MKEEQETKKEWAAPEIVDLDVDKTSSNISAGVVENYSSHPAAS